MLNLTFVWVQFYMWQYPYLEDLLTSDIDSLLNFVVSKCQLTSIQEWWPKLTMNRRCCLLTLWLSSLGCRHNGRDGVSNHQHHDCLLNRLFWCRSRKTSKLRVTGLCVGNSPGTGEFPTQMASNAENVSFWWRRHVPREPGPVLICDKMSYHKIVRSY